jgi:tetratricopeptide (TPR) repeat protein
MALNPGYPAIRTYLGRTLVVAGQPEAALPHMEIETAPFWHVYGMVLVLYALERHEEAEKRFAALIEAHADEAAMQIAEINAFIGRPDEAFRWLQLAMEQDDPGISELLGNPLLESLSGDPRWAGLLIELGLDRHDPVNTN